MVKKPKWIKKQKYSDEFEIIAEKKYHNIKDFKFDKGCYLLIKTYKKTERIGVAICDYNHFILKEFRGKSARDLYLTILDYDKEHKSGWFTRLDHAAYLGKELKKAEICLAMGNEYVQE
ncbi:MAG TPA: DUF4346 domain-containing protein [Candidatus Nanoarchaeia archaeon]|nr:DUF4346 domain-containing protein [Candidatus Nanoarchaeia archaeon]